MEQTDKRVYDLLNEVEKEQKTGSDGNIHLSSGVVLRAKKVPPLILSKIDEKYPEPTMPTVRDEDRGRNIPNPEDPSYLRAIDDNNRKKGTAIIDVLAGLGTEIVSVPEDFPKHTDTEWADNLIVFGISDVPEKGVGRYLAWLRYVVIQTPEDLAQIARKSAASLGIAESEVSAAISGFSDQKKRDTDSGDNP